MADVLGSLNQATAKKKVVKKPVAAFDALSVLGNALNAAPPVKQKPLMAQPVAGTRVDGVLNETTGQLTARPLMAQPVPGTSANGLKNEATGEVQNAQGQKVKRYNLALENGVNLSFDSNRELTPDELQQTVNDIADREEFKKLEKVAAAKKKERSQMATPNVGPYSNQTIAENNQRRYEQMTGPDGLAIAKKMTPQQIQSLPIEVRRSLQSRMIGGMNKDANNILPTAASIIPKAVDATALMVQGIADPNVQPSDFSLTEGVTPKGRKKMNPVTKVTSAIGNVGSYFLPYVGQMRGAVDTANVVQRIASGGGQQVVKETLDGLNVFDPNIDPLERGLRAINVMGAVYGGYHLSKGVAKGAQALEVSKQLKISVPEALKIVNWAEEASAKGPKRTGINEAGREDATGTAASIALGNYEPPVAAGRGASNVPLNMRETPKLGPTPPIKANRIPVVDPAQSEKVTPPVRGEIKPKVPTLAEIQGGNRLLRKIDDPEYIRHEADDVLKRMRPDDPRIDPKSRFFNKQVHDAVASRVYDPELDSLDATTGEMLHEWQQKQPRAGRMNLTQTEAEYLADIRGAYDKKRVPLKKNKYGQWVAAGKPVTFVDIGQGATPDQLRAFFEWYGYEKNSGRSSITLSKYEKLKATQSNLKGGIQQDSELMGNTENRSGDSAGGNEFGDTWVPAHILNKYRAYMRESWKAKEEYGQGGVTARDQKMLEPSGKTGKSINPKATFDAGANLKTPEAKSTFVETKLGNPNEKAINEGVRDVQEGQGVRGQGEQPQGQGYGQKANTFQEKGQVTPESVGVKSGMQDPHAGKTGVWKGPDSDQPIKIEKTLGAKDGRTYVKVEGSNTGIPLDEITVDAPKPSSTRTRASKAEPTPVAPTAGEPNQTGIKMSTRSEEAARGLTGEPVSISGKPLTELQREGVARVESGKVDPYALVQTLATKGRPATDVEYGSIAAGRAKLIKRVEEAQSVYDNATGAAKEEARSEYHKALDAATEFDGHLDKVKSASGRSLNALKIGSNLNEASSAEVVIEARRRNPKVSPKKEAELTNLANIVRDTNAADKAAVADAVVSQAKADPVYSFKGKKEAIRAERNTLLQQLEKARKTGNSGNRERGAATLPTDILKIYGKIGLTYAKEGLVTFEEIADAIRSHAKANGHGLSDDDVHEALRLALPAGRKLTELELKNRRLNEIARNRIRAILGDLKPVSGVKRVENVLRELQLSNPVSRVMDWLSNEATKLAYIGESPVRYVVTRGKEKPIGPVAYRELMRGSRDRWSREAAQVMAGADPDAIAKYGKAPGIVSKVTGLSDIQFKDFYHQVVYRDVAVKTHPKDIKAQREMIDQLNGITDGGPLSDGAVADIQAEANDFALRKTFNADNWFASATTAGAGTLRREAYNGMVKHGVSEKLAANAADALAFIPNVAFRYSKVIGNVAHDSVTRTGAGMLEASAGRVAAGMKVEREGLRIRLRRVGISDAQSRILSDKFARGLTGAALTGIGAAMAAKGIMKPDVVKTKSGYFFDYGELEQLPGWVKPLLVGSTIQTINEMNIPGDQKMKLIAKAIGDIALNQPLTSGFKQVSNLADTANAPKALGRLMATALVPGIVAGAARMHDKMTTGTGYRKTKDATDEFKSRIPILRQQLDSGEKSRTKGRPGLPL